MCSVSSCVLSLVIWFIFSLICACVERFSIRLAALIVYLSLSGEGVEASLPLIYLSFLLTYPHNEGDNGAIKTLSVSICVCRTSRRRSRLIMMFSGVWRGIRWRWWRLWGAQRRPYSSSRDWMTWTSAGTTWRPNLLIYGQSHTNAHVYVKVTWKSSHESVVRTDGAVFLLSCQIEQLCV